MAKAKEAYNQYVDQIKRGKRHNRKKKANYESTDQVVFFKDKGYYFHAVQKIIIIQDSRL